MRNVTFPVHQLASTFLLYLQAVAEEKLGSCMGAWTNLFGITKKKSPLSSKMLVANFANTRFMESKNVYNVACMQPQQSVQSGSN